MQELDRELAIDPTEHDALFRELAVRAGMIAKPIEQDLLDELMEVVAPGTPRTPPS